MTADTAESTIRRVRNFLRLVVRIATPYWQSEEKWKVRGLVILLVLLTICQMLIQFGINEWSKQFFDALEQRSLDRFFMLIGVFGLVLVASMTVSSSHLWVKRRIQLDWRRRLTRMVIGDWMAAGRQFQVTHIPGRHDNPDGRIAEDIRVAAETAMDLGHSMLYCALLLVCFVSVLWNLSGTLELTVFGTAVSVPGHMVWVALIYSAVASALATVVGWPLVRAADKRQSAEANFRFALVRGRENAEAIALVRGEPDERRRLLDLFADVPEDLAPPDLGDGAAVHVHLGLRILSSAFPILITAPRYIAGTITLGALMQTAQAFRRWPRRCHGRSTTCRAWPSGRPRSTRVMALCDALKHSTAAVRVHRWPSSGSHDRPPPLAWFRHLTIANPDGDVVLSDFDCEVAKASGC